MSEPFMPTPYQKVIIRNIIVNGSSSDFEGTFIREMKTGPYKGLWKIRVNTVDINVDPKKIYPALFC